MNYLQTYILLLIKLGILGSQIVESAEVKTIRIRNGELFGERRDHFYAFEGIPYAESPVGDLRFEPPREYTQEWKKPFNATRAGKVAGFITFIVV